MIRNLILKILLAIVLLELISGCVPEKFDNVLEIWDMEVNLVNADTTINLSQTDVSLTNSVNGFKATLSTNAHGIVTFKNIIAGNYIISALKITEENNRSTIIGGTKTDITISPLQQEFSLPVKQYSLTDIVIKEVFYASSYTPKGIGYLSDQFIELYNNSTKTIFTDSLCIGLVYGAAGQMASSPSIFSSDTSKIYLQSIWMIPGTIGKLPLHSGESLLIAQDAINHKTDPSGNPNSINLSDADWETFWENTDDQKDVDYVETPNLHHYLDFSNSFHDWIFLTHGVSIVIFRIKDKNKIGRAALPNDIKLRKLITIPSDWVIDGFESLDSPGKLSYKKLPYSIDMSYFYCSGIFNMESCRRKSILDKNGRRILIDTNSSFSDFEIVSPPTPKSFE